MSPTQLLVFLVIGAVAGWLAGVITKGSGFGLLGNIIVGIVGAFLGGFCFGLLGIAAFSFVGRLLFALVGALVFTWLLGYIKK
ncbi:MAG: GlsB/YeaQ/YmgE family stress response membrane protein [Opitutaceae bacterium]|jgi:uncharacterized membrane protein YeaQ/YmgE (transglycosylase-associated protein family)